MTGGLSELRGWFRWRIDAQTSAFPGCTEGSVGVFYSLDIEEPAMGWNW